MDAVIRGLRVTRAGRVVLDVEQLTLAEGTTTAVFGPNGSGKTTLLRALAGLEPAAAGTVTLGGRPIARGEHPPVALAFQEAVFVRGSVRENLALGLELRRVPEAERAARLAVVARECGIEMLLDRGAHALSSGEAQRVNLARALALQSPLTLLDEPLAGVDRATRNQLLRDLPRLLSAFAATTVIVTHDREEAFRLADHLVILLDGRVRASGPKAEVYRKPPDRVTAELLGYTVLEAAEGPVALAPGALRLGSGGRWQWTLVVERVVDLGNHRHLIGTVDGIAVDLRLRGEEEGRVPGPGEKAAVHAADGIGVRGGH
jgi:ABC-type sugar transport system ATPase subunit